MDQHVSCSHDGVGTHRDGKVVKFQDVRNGTESFLEVGNLLESVSKLNDWSLPERAILAHREPATLERIQVGRNQK